MLKHFPNFDNFWQHIINTNHDKRSLVFLFLWWLSSSFHPAFKQIWRSFPSLPICFLKLPFCYFICARRVGPPLCWDNVFSMFGFFSSFLCLISINRHSCGQIIPSGGVVTFCPSKQSSPKAKPYR